jgi:hypothetical protein
MRLLRSHPATSERVGALLSLAYGPSSRTR